MNTVSNAEPNPIQKALKTIVSCNREAFRQMLEEGLNSSDNLSFEILEGVLVSKGLLAVASD